MADKDTGSVFSEQTTIDPDSVSFTPRACGFTGNLHPSEPSSRAASKSAGPSPTSSAMLQFGAFRAGSKSAGPSPTNSTPMLGAAPPATFMDLAAAGYFKEPEPKSKLALLAGSISNSVSSFGGSFKTKTPGLRRYWGSAPSLRKEWYWLKGEQCLPLGFNRWERFAPEEENMLTTMSDLQTGFMGLTHYADVGEEDAPQQVWLAAQQGSGMPLAGLNKVLWEPRGIEEPASELLRAGKAKTLSGHIMTFTKDRAIVEEYFATAPYLRGKPPSVRVVLLVQETMQSAVEEHSGELLSNPEYVLRVCNPAGLPVVGFKKHELEKRRVRDMVWRFQDLWHEKGDAVFISEGREMRQDQELTAVLKKIKARPLDVSVMYLNEEQARLKSEGYGTITEGRFVNLHMEGYFHSPPPQASQAKQQQKCCVVS